LNNKQEEVCLKKFYEITREVYNPCAGSQRPDIFIDEVETDEAGIDALIKDYLVGNNVDCQKTVTQNGEITVEITTDSLRQRITFCEI
jgi:hypothetical protein